MTYIHELQQQKHIDIYSYFLVFLNSSTSSPKYKKNATLIEVSKKDIKFLQFILKY